MAKKEQPLPCITEGRKWHSEWVDTEIERKPLHLGPLSLQLKPKIVSEHCFIEDDDVPDEIVAQREFRCKTKPIKLSLMSGYHGSPTYVLVAHGVPTLKFEIGMLVINIDDNAQQPLAEFTFKVKATRGDALTAEATSVGQCVLTCNQQDFDRFYSEVGATHQ